MTRGQMPIARKCPMSGSAVGSKGNRPNRLKTLVGSGCDKSLIQPKKGALPHFDRDEQDLVEREEHRDLNDHRQAAATGLIFSRL